jgi:hypothetical protein
MRIKRGSLEPCRADLSAANVAPLVADLIALMMRTIEKTLLEIPHMQGMRCH